MTCIDNLYRRNATPVAGPTQSPRGRRPAVAFVLSMVVAGPGASAASFDIVGPAGSASFGLSVKALPNGNIVVVDPEGPTSGIGAVYLYGPNGNLISTITGGSPNDHAGSGGITVLPDSHFVVASPHFTNGAIADAGALTQIDGAVGLNGVVAADNSLVGSSAGDQVGYGGDPVAFPYDLAPDVALLDAQHYLVFSPSWSNGGAAQAGAVTFVDIAAPVLGAVSAANSLVGSRTNDHVGGGGLAIVGGGNIVIISPDWNSALHAQVGAVTWMSGSTGFSGTVGSGNSLVGLTAMDQVGLLGVVVLANGNYVVDSPLWSNGATASVGAVTWATGTARTAGLVSPLNSLFGSTANDQVGIGGVTALPNGNYVVASPDWTNGAANQAGAATWCSGGGGCSGPVSTGNSLVGSQTGDSISSDGVTALANGNYVVSSPGWANGAATRAGAATWLPGTAMSAASVSDQNSLVGAQTEDQVGDAVALADGSYVVDSGSWANGAVPRAGAVTWASGTNGISGAVTQDNSLVGSQINDFVGGNGVVPLAGGSYVVVSSFWSNGAATHAGALTMGAAGSALTGPVSAANSLVGEQTNDFVGAGNSIVLANGDYVALSPNWANGAVAQAGAATRLQAGVSVSGTISAANSLVGTSTADDVGAFARAIGVDGYVVSSPNWNDPITATAHVGAVTYVRSGANAVGTISSGNSLIGTAANDKVGSGVHLPGPNVTLSGLRAQLDGNYLVLSGAASNGAVSAAGAITLGTGRFRQVGTLQSWNSVRGALANEGTDMPFDYDPVGHRLVVGRPQENLVTVLDQEQIFADGFD